MSAPEQPKPKAGALTPPERAERVRQLLISRKAPPLEEGDAIRKLSSNATLAVILMTDDMFRAATFKQAPSWEQYAVICGVIACLSDSITQFTGLPREGVPYMVADAIHFLFAGPDRAKWPKTEGTYSFAVTQYKHMMEKPELNAAVDQMGGAFFKFLMTDEAQHLDLMKQQFKGLVETPDVPAAIRDKPKGK